MSDSMDAVIRSDSNKRLRISETDVPEYVELYQKLRGHGVTGDRISMMLKGQEGKQLLDRMRNAVGLVIAQRGAGE